MLCPEVWNFKAPESNFKIEKGDHQNNCLNTINNFYYNHLVSLVLPDTLKVPEQIFDCLTSDCEYYKIKKLNISELVKKNFIENFVKRGCLITLSVKTRIDCDNCIASTPEAVLILSLNKETYQTLGIEGKVCHFNKKTSSRYIVRIDLKLNIFQNYEKLSKKLEKINCDVILNWEPYNEEICPSSIAKYFHDLKYEVKLCTPKHDTRTEYQVQIPLIDFDNFDVNECYEMVEWLGMILLKCDVENCAPDNYLSSYQTPTPNIQIGQMRILQWRGFFTHQQISRLYEHIKNFATVEKKPWISLYVQGFSDAAVNWKEREHHYYINGDNSYILLLNSSKYLLCKQICSFKTYK